MISTKQEYLDVLYQIQSDTDHPLNVVLLLPSTEPIVEIDLESRTIEAPSFLNVEKDHRAETIIFSVDRYYDNIDLSTTNIIIQYVNALGEARICPIRTLDLITKRTENKILFPWQITSELTKAAGEVSFAVQFYTLEEETKQFVYCLNTAPTTSRILEGLEGPDEGSVRDEDPSVLEYIFDQIGTLRDTHQVYWKFLAEKSIDENDDLVTELVETPLEIS